jgi:iron complex outermembrane receptor protein
MYSTNTPGGIVNVVTAAPKLDEFEGSGTIEYGNYGLLHTAGAMNAPINDFSAVRAAFSTSSHDGYNTNGTSDEDAKAARIRFLFQPNERFSFIASDEYQRAGSRGYGGVAGFAKQSDVDNPWTPRGGPGGSPPTTPEPTYKDRNKIYGQFEVDAGIGTITFLPSYVTLVQTRGGQDFRTGDPTMTENNMRERSFEMRMASKADSPFTYIFGLSHYHTVDRSLTTTDNPPLNSWSYLLLDQKSQAAYGNITIPVTDVFRGTGGVRYSKNNFHTMMIRYPDDMNLGSPEPSIEDGTMLYDGTDYKVGIEYDIREDVMFYADYSSSFRTQGMAMQDVRDVRTGERKSIPFPPEEMTSYTAGLKSRFFGNRFQLNASGYYYDYDNYFGFINQQSVAQEDLNNDGDYNDTVNGVPETARTLDNNSKIVGAAKSYGLDVMTSMIITSKDRLDVSISYGHKEFTKMFWDWSDVTNGLGIPDLDLSGKLMPMAPEWTINGNYSHNFSLANGGVLTARIDSKLVSEYIVSWNHIQMNLDPNWQPVLVDNTAINQQESYMMSNFTLVYTDPSGGWTFSGYMKNIENYAAKLGSGMGSLNITSPRTYGGILTITF